MDAAFTNIPEKFSNITKLSKIERMKQFAEQCLGHPVNKEICLVTYKAIVQHMIGG